MTRRPLHLLALICLFTIAPTLLAQKPPYDKFPSADPPYYRVRYEASLKPGELPYPVNYTIWIPPGVKTLRGVVVHQHGCGEGSCKSGLTGAYDLHWQALAKKHDCALLAPSYEQPEKADCQMWCDPRNGSDAAFQKCLADLGTKSGHSELATVPWALWGHSGGGHWAGGMVMLHPDRVAAAWLRSGVPLLKADPKRASIKAHTLPDAALKVPIMCNLGTKEGVTIKAKNFGGVWPANEVFFHEVRGRGGLVGVAVDPLTAHECGNQRYLAIPWLDVCLTARLPKAAGEPLRPMPTDGVWLTAPLGGDAVPAAKFAGEPLKAAWLPNEAIAKAWLEYVKDTKVTDTTPPPAPTNVRLKGNTLTWEAEADLESGLAGFVIERDGQVLATVPKQAKNPFGRPVFQNLQYSDTPTQPLVPMEFTDPKAEGGKEHIYRVIAVNTVGLKSKPSAESRRATALKLSWDKNILSIAGPKIPGGDIKILYLEAYCRPGSTDRDWRETVVGHKTELLDADRDGRTLKLRCTLHDGVIVDHVITATGDEVDFRLTAHNPTKKTSLAHWAQPCVRVDRFTGRGQKDYLPKCFVFHDGKPARLPLKPWATNARYIPGQVWCPKNVDRNDVNPRPLSEVVPSNGLIGCYSADEKWIMAMAWEPYQELFQGVIVCVHSDFRIGGLTPGETKKIRGKLYIVPAQMEELRKRYEKDFPEHARMGQGDE